MEQVAVHGGRPLSGTVRVSGAKNAALPIMAASILTRGTVLLRNVPRLTDVQTMVGVLRALGVMVEWVGPNKLMLMPQHAGGKSKSRQMQASNTAPADLVRQMRASICVLGPLLAVRGKATMPPPGGCVIGPRPIDLHLNGLRALGARIRIDEQSRIYAQADRLHGARVHLAGPQGSTVLGTANVMMAATLAKGRTVIEYAACEPEVQDLAHFLNACGARITGIGSPTLNIDGVEQLGGCDHTLIPDRIEAATFLAAGAITGGDVTLREVRTDHMEAVIEVLDRMGARFRKGKGTLTVVRPSPLKPADFETAPYPGVPTDMQPQLSALLCLARGRSIVREQVFPHRFTHVAELERMGAHVVCYGTCAIIEGTTRLHRASVSAADLRAGAALTLAALATDGITTITGVDQIDRGYQGLVEKLKRLGADIRRQHVDTPERRARKSA